MKRQQKDMYILVIFGFILLGIIVVILIITIGAKNLHPTTQQASGNLTIPTVAPQTGLWIRYDTTAQNRLLNALLNRQTLAANDATAKQKVLSFLPQGQTAGIVYSSSTVSIEYLQSADMFMAEIFTTNIEQAKTDVDTWFHNQGMSQQGVCDLPVMFYLSPGVITALQNNPIIFSPLPDSC